MGILSMGEITRIVKLETKITNLELGAQVGVGERKVQEINKNTSSTSSKNSDRFQSLLLETVDLPWCNDAHWQAHRMMDLARSGRFADLMEGYSFSAKESSKLALAIDPTTDITQEQWGHAILAYGYGLGMKSRLKPLHESLKFDWDAVSDNLSKMLVGCVGVWADVLRYKVVGNTVVFTWKNTPREHRNSPEMKAMIQEHRYMEQLVEFNNIVPRDSHAPFNALAIASRLVMRERYFDLYGRLQRADKSYCDIEKIVDADFDDDFDDFKAWHAEVNKEAS